MANKRSVKYNPKTKRVIINANSTEFYPPYAKYLFEYLKIPANATIIFRDRTIKGGIEAWLKENKYN